MNSFCKLKNKEEHMKKPLLCYLLHDWHITFPYIGETKRCCQRCGKKQFRLGLENKWSNKEHSCNFELVEKFGGLPYEDRYYRCKCGQGKVWIHGFNAVLSDHPYGKKLINPNKKSK